MSAATPARNVKLTSDYFLKLKEQRQKFAMVTCYDSSFARLIDFSPVEMVLVGDSLGNVMLGFDSTVRVTMDHMVHHTAAVSRTLTRPFLVADMPFMSYHLNCEQALTNAARLIQEGGAHAVKLEGGVEIADKVRAIVNAGIPVVGHLGLTPQSVHVLGGYRVQGKGAKARERLLQDALALESAGAMAVVLELIPASLAKEVTESLIVPTIGIGAGVDCDGQVLVLQDLLGFNQSFRPKFLKRYANIEKIVGDALMEFHDDVKSAAYPTIDHSFSDE